MQRGASLSAVNCDGDVPLDIAVDETTESLLQDYTLKQGEAFSLPVSSGHYTQLSQDKHKCVFFPVHAVLTLQY